MMKLPEVHSETIWLLQSPESDETSEGAFCADAFCAGSAGPFVYMLQ